jgi:hypothetical protein
MAKMVLSLVRSLSHLYLRSLWYEELKFDRFTILTKLINNSNPQHSSDLENFHRTRAEVVYKSLLKKGADIG